MKTEVENALARLPTEQEEDPKLKQILERIRENNPSVNPYYYVLNNVIITRPTPRENSWKVYVPKTLESPIIMDYHIIYGHMGPLKVVKALEEHFYIKGIHKKVRQTIKTYKLCQL